MAIIKNPLTLVQQAGGSVTKKYYHFIRFNNLNFAMFNDLIINDDPTPYTDHTYGQYLYNNNYRSSSNYKPIKDSSFALRVVNDGTYNAIKKMIVQGVFGTWASGAGYRTQVVNFSTLINLTENGFENVSIGIEAGYTFGSGDVVDTVVVGLEQ